jgi:hypothetical protein
MIGTDSVNDLIPSLYCAGSAVLDAISDLTGYAAVRVPLQRASLPGEFTLNVPGYRQIDSFSCGAVAGAMAVKFLRPGLSFERIYETVDPCRQTGVGTARMLRALRSLGIRVNHQADLTFHDICGALQSGSPVLACVSTRQPDVTHWVTIYGFGLKPHALFVAGQGLPFVGRQRIAWKHFARLWLPAGAGLVCRKKSKSR